MIWIPYTLDRRIDGIHNPRNYFYLRVKGTELEALKVAKKVLRVPHTIYSDRIVEY